MSTATTTSTDTKEVRQQIEAAGKKLAKLNPKSVQLEAARKWWKSGNLYQMHCFEVLRKMNVEIELIEARQRGETKEFTHHMQPYGSVRFEAMLVERDVDEWEYHSGRSRKTGRKIPQQFAVGIVVSNNYCGALLCGNRIGTHDHYPAGTVYECAVYGNDWSNGDRLSVSCG